MKYAFEMIIKHNIFRVQEIAWPCEHCIHATWRQSGTAWFPGALPGLSISAPLIEAAQGTPEPKAMSRKMSYAPCIEMSDSLVENY